MIPGLNNSTIYGYLYKLVVYIVKQEKNNADKEEINRYTFIATSFIGLI